jgi:hypothetical protein
MSYNSGGRIVSDGLVMYLDAANRKSFVSGSSVWRDLSNNSRSGSLINGPSFNSINGGVISFDGTDDVVSGSINGDIFTGSFTQTAWIYKLNANQIWQGVFNNSSPATNYAYSMTFGNGSVAAPYNSVGVNQVGVLENGIFLDIGTHINKWLYIVITKSSSTINIYCYKDGSLLQNSGTITWNSGNFAKTNNYQVGRHWASTVSNIPFQGYIPQITVYSRTLSATEILNNYNVTKKRFGL